MRGDGFGGPWGLSEDGSKGARRKGILEERRVKRIKPTLKALNRSSAISGGLLKQRGLLEIPQA